jgi:hypothetical protein
MSENYKFYEFVYSNFFVSHIVVLQAAICFHYIKNGTVK